MREITPAQRRVYDAIFDFEEKHGRRPILQDLADALGMRSKSNIWAHLRKLERAGWIKLEYRHVVTIQSLRPKMAA